MAAFHTRFPFTFVITTGDNIYGTDRPEDFRVKFELPYKTILEKGVKFYAVLGNHDNPTQRFYQPFNMGGQRFYTFRGSSGGVAKVTQGGVRFFMLDSNYMDKAELDWLAKELAARRGRTGRSPSSITRCTRRRGRHGSSLDLRAILEPVLVQGKVNVVFTGHDHIYERVKPQKGIYSLRVRLRRARCARATSAQRPSSRPAATTATSRSCWSRSTATTCTSSPSTDWGRRWTPAS